MDSVTALYQAHQEQEVLAAISFDYGSKHNHREIPFAQWHCERLGVPHAVLPLDFIGKTFESDLLKKGRAIPEGHYEETTMKQTVVPFRNGILLAIATGFAESRGADGVVIAAHAGDHTIYPDCREEFMDAQAEAIRLGTYAGIHLLRPFIALTKEGIVREGVKLGVDYAQTWSCYVGGEIHCGRCGTCVERREAFLLAEVPDPTPYANTGHLPQKPGAAPC